MVKVCDAIMGSGKSSAAITYMNEHPDERFIYITPYLEEANRIKQSCPSLHFIEPSNRIPEYDFSKCNHITSLIHDGRNITSTHQLFRKYTNEILEDIQKYKYHLIIDEDVDMLNSCYFCKDDLNLLIDGGYINKNEDDTLSYTGKEYNGSLLPLIQAVCGNEAIEIECDDDISPTGNAFYWTLSPELITSFREVTILTYMFKEQSLCHFLNMYHIPYSYIGIKRSDKFRFCDEFEYTPEYVSHLGDMIDILDNDKLNCIGEEHYALSMNWFNQNDNAIKLKNNIYNYINNVWRSIPASDKMWGSFCNCRTKISGKGYTKSFVPFNIKATNAYRDKHYLVYAANIFMNVNEKRYYRKYGITVDDDYYALSIMVQWIWRSAIRDGDKIYLYIPSGRMRSLLIDWINKTSKEGNKVEK